MLILNILFLQSREKCAFKVHLGDAVEEMKKLCSRYALKSFVKNCVSSTHWVIPATVDLSGDSYSDIEEDDIVGICKTFLIYFPEINFTLVVTFYL